MSSIRETIIIGLVLIAIALAIVHFAMGCATLTPEEKQAIALDGVRIAVCQDRGRECQRLDGGACYRVYDACMADGGFR